MPAIARMARSYRVWRFSARRAHTAPYETITGGRRSGLRPRLIYPGSLAGRSGDKSIADRVRSYQSTPPQIHHQCQ